MHLVTPVTLRHCAYDLVIHECLTQLAVGEPFLPGHALGVFKRICNSVVASIDPATLLLRMLLSMHSVGGITLRLATARLL